MGYRFVVIQSLPWSSDRYKILHMSRQPSCRDMCQMLSRWWLHFSLLQTKTKCPLYLNFEWGHFSEISLVPGASDRRNWHGMCFSRCVCLYVAAIGAEETDLWRWKSRPLSNWNQCLLVGIICRFALKVLKSKCDFSESPSFFQCPFISQLG